MTELLEEFSFAQIENYPVTDVKNCKSNFRPFQNLEKSHEQVWTKIS